MHVSYLTGIGEFAYQRYDTAFRRAAAGIEMSVLVDGAPAIADWASHRIDELSSSGRGVHHGMHITTTTCHSADIGVARVPTKHWGVVGRGWSLSLCSPRWGLGCSATVCDQCIHRRFEHLAIAVRSLSNETGSSCSDRA